MKFVVARASELQVMLRGEERDAEIAALASEIEGSLLLRVLYRQALKSRALKRSLMTRWREPMRMSGGRLLVILYFAIKALTLVLLVAQLFILQV